MTWDHSSAIVMGSNFIVDGERGDNATAEPGSANRPYATIAAAVAAAVSGDVVQVRGGQIYNERNLLKNGVDIHGPEADVIYTGAAVGGIFDDSAANGANAACVSNITLRYISLSSTGAGAPAGNNGAVNIENANSNVVVNCIDIANTIPNGSWAQRCAVYCEAGKLVVRAQRRLSSAQYDAIICGENGQACTLAIECDEIYTPPTLGGDGIEYVAGDLSVRCRKITSTGSCINGVYDTGTFRVFIDAQEIVGQALCVEGLFPTDRFFIRAMEMRSNTQHAVETEGGSPEIIGAVIRGGGAAAAVSLLGGDIKLNNCRLIKGGGSDALAGTGNATIYGSLTADGTKAGTVTMALGTYPVSNQTYALTNATTDRAYDADTVLHPEIADVLGTLVADLRAKGLVN